MYTVTFKNLDGIETRSLCFETVRKARNWFKELQTKSFVTEVRLYHGQPGECLLDCALIGNTVHHAVAERVELGQTWESALVSENID
jgi:hypothetical protein